MSSKIKAEHANKNTDKNPQERLAKKETPARPRTLSVKTEEYYNVRLPTYEESQRKYEKFLRSIKD